MNQPTTIHLPGLRAASWNQYWAGRHHAARSRDKRTSSALVRAALDPNACELYTVPVAITVLAEYKRNPVDCDNVCTKALIDGLRGWLIQNDDPRYVRSFTTISRRGDSDSVTIYIEPAEGER